MVHVNQIKSYYCGPASAYMMLSYMGLSASVYNGAKLSQTNLASSTYLRTEANGATTWRSGAMAIGLNRWRGGTFYVQVNRPTAAVVRAALTNDIGNVGLPIAADTVEIEGLTHYNGHPLNQTIGHWIVGYGYQQSGAISFWQDPSPPYFPAAAPTFSTNTTTFANTFLNTSSSNGIAW